MTDEQWMEQVVMLREQIAAETKAAANSAVREHTAATILAALIARGAPLEVDQLTETTVEIADALRRELERKP